MVQYECNICNYKTKNKSNHIKHCNTKKHMEKESVTSNKYINNNSNIIKLFNCSQKTLIGLSKDSSKTEYICDFCHRTFTRSNNLGRHLKSCSTKQNVSDHYKNLELNDHVKNLNIEMDKYKDEAKYYKQMLMEAGGLVKKSVSALTYSVQNYDNAPAIKTINVDDIETFENPKKKIIEDVLSYYKHKTLNRHLGDIILKLYKKDDPKTQSVWSTDDSRLTYLIRELLNNKSSNWIIDKKGVKTVSYLIDPLLEYIKNLIIFYQTNYNIPSHGQNIIEVEMMLENSKKIIELVNDIDDGIIAKEILKYISSHLRFYENSLQ